VGEAVVHLGATYEVWIPYAKSLSKHIKAMRVLQRRGFKLLLDAIKNVGRMGAPYCARSLAPDLQVAKRKGETSMSVTTRGAGSVEEPEAAVLGPSTSISRPYAVLLSVTRPPPS
jgi:hypothetical protein